MDYGKLKEETEDEEWLQRRGVQLHQEEPISVKSGSNLQIEKDQTNSTSSSDDSGSDDDDLDTEEATFVGQVSNRDDYRSRKHRYTRMNKDDETEMETLDAKSSSQANLNDASSYINLPPPSFLFVGPDQRKLSLAFQVDKPDDTQDALESFVSKYYPDSSEDETNQSDINPYDHYHLDLTLNSALEATMQARRKKIFLVMVAVDFLYCILLLFINWSITDEDEESQRAHRNLILNLGVNIMIDVLGFVGALRNSLWSMTVFIVVEGITIGLYTFASFSPILVILRLAIFLLGLQVRMGIIREQAQYWNPDVDTD